MPKNRLIDIWLTPVLPVSGEKCKYSPPIEPSSPGWSRDIRRRVSVSGGNRSSRHSDMEIFLPLARKIWYTKSLTFNPFLHQKWGWILVCSIEKKSYIFVYRHHFSLKLPQGAKFSPQMWCFHVKMVVPALGVRKVLSPKALSFHSSLELRWNLPECVYYGPDDDGCWHVTPALSRASKAHAVVRIENSINTWPTTADRIPLMKALYFIPKVHVPVAIIRFSMF